MKQCFFLCPFPIPCLFPILYPIPIPIPPYQGNESGGARVCGFGLAINCPKAGIQKSPSIYLTPYRGAGLYGWLPGQGNTDFCKLAASFNKSIIVDVYRAEILNKWLNVDELDTCKQGVNRLKTIALPVLKPIRSKIVVKIQVVIARTMEFLGMLYINITRYIDISIFREFVHPRNNFFDHGQIRYYFWYARSQKVKRIGFDRFGRIYLDRIEYKLTG